MANENYPLYRPGQDITVQASAGVTGKRFVKISGNREATDNNIAVAHADAAGRVFGVSKYDIASGKKGGVIRGSGNVVQVTTASNLTAFQEVEVGANGQATAKASGVAVGYAVTGASSGADAEIALYN